VDDYLHTYPSSTTLTHSPLPPLFVEIEIHPLRGFFFFVPVIEKQLLARRDVAKREHPDSAIEKEKGQSFVTCMSKQSGGSGPPKCVGIWESPDTYRCSPRHINTLGTQFGVSL